MDRDDESFSRHNGDVTLHGSSAASDESALKRQHQGGGIVYSSGRPRLRSTPCAVLHYMALALLHAHKLYSIVSFMANSMWLSPSITLDVLAAPSWMFA
mmetsp:Transcript_8819/g.18870  ORF Transcript_8819/g.18870 Transcript_8819/m.18870 type:complete len:99 (-) Transcript_8819:371-667(-)